MRRAALWSPDAWAAADELPSAACIVEDHADVELDVAVIEEARDRDLAATLWEPGGTER